jgi:TPR repeat protein
MPLPPSPVVHVESTVRKYFLRNLNVTVICFQDEVLLLCPLAVDVHQIEEAHVKRFKFLLFVTVLAGFAALAYAGYGDGKAAYDNGNFPAAFKEFQASATLGDAESQYFLGLMYDKGQGVAEDKAEAMTWYRKAADQGYAKAQSSMGDAYRTGKGVQQDYGEAVKYYRKAAEQGDADAQYNLGNMYGEGHGVAQDYAEAVKWCRKAADQGDPLAQTSLGWAYANGNGVPQDYVQAHMWFSLALAQDYSEAQKGIDEIAGKMTPAQTAEAQRLAKEWLPKSRE